MQFECKNNTDKCDAFVEITPNRVRSKRLLILQKIKDFRLIPLCRRIELGFSLIFHKTVSH